MKIIVYHFWSPTCGPCQAIKPVIEDLKEEFPDFTWVSVNTQFDPNDYKSKFGVQIVPTIVATAVDETGKLVSSEKQTGTNVSGYYRILRNCIKLIQQ